MQLLKICLQIPQNNNSVVKAKFRRVTRDEKTIDFNLAGTVYGVGAGAGDSRGIN